MATAYNDAYNALLTICSGASSLANVTVIDGPPVNEDFPTIALHIGWSGNIEGFDGGGISTSYHELGPLARMDEASYIPITIQAFSGDDGFSGPRAAAVAALDAFIELLRANPSLGVARIRDVVASDAQVDQVVDDQGCVVQISLTVSITALI